MSDLRDRLIRLAYEHPDLRSALLPLLKKAATVSTRSLSPREVEDVKQHLKRQRGKKFQFRDTNLIFGGKVQWRGQDWVVYDRDSDRSDPEGFTFVLVSPDGSEMARFIPSVEIKTGKRASLLQVGQGGENDKIRYHLYSGSLNVTDLENAGKRGKTVRTLSLGYNHRDISQEFYKLLEALPKADYDKIKKMAEQVIATAPDRVWYTLNENTEKGVRVTPAGFSPVEILGKNVYVKAGFDDFVIKDRKDRANEPTCIPAIRGGKRDIKVFYRWVKDNEKQIRTMDFHAVLKAMSKEGISFHQYCAMD